MGAGALFRRVETIGGLDAANGVGTATIAAGTISVRPARFVAEVSVSPLTGISEVSPPKVPT